MISLFDSVTIQNHDVINKRSTRGTVRPQMAGHAPWGPAALNAAKTHCKRGHEFTKENTLKEGNKRSCRICRNNGAKLARRKRALNEDEFYRKQNLHYSYGLTIQSFDEMVNAQNGLCLICLKLPDTGKKKRLYVDHCHETGAIRGLLCNRCNSAIGLLGENTETMGRAIEYILKNRGKKEIT